MRRCQASRLVPNDVRSLEPLRTAERYVGTVYAVVAMMLGLNGRSPGTGCFGFATRLMMRQLNLDMPVGAKTQNATHAAQVEAEPHNKAQRPGG